MVIERSERESAFLLDFRLRERREINSNFDSKKSVARCGGWAFEARWTFGVWVSVIFGVFFCFR